MSGGEREIWEVTRDMLDWFQAFTRWGIDWVAEELSKRTGKVFQPRTIYRYQEADGLQIHLSTAIVLSQICNNSPASLKLFAHRLDYAVIKLPTAPTRLPREVPALITALKETTEAIKISAEAIESRTCDSQRMEQVEKEIMEGIEGLYILREVLRECWKKTGGNER